MQWGPGERKEGLSAWSGLALTRHTTVGEELFLHGSVGGIYCSSALPPKLCLRLPSLSDGDAGGTPVEPTFNAPLLPPLRPPLSKKNKRSRGEDGGEIAFSLSFSAPRGLVPLLLLGERRQQRRREEDHEDKCTNVNTRLQKKTRKKEDR